jgi:hypothetical protein
VWLRINSDSSTIKRILGPIGSNDGVYVDGPFLTLKIGKNTGSYYVGEWTRPMLMHVRVSENYASMLINGEEVISLNYITSELSLPSKLNSLGKDQDWIGFYSYTDVSPVEIDCVAIYSYQVPLVLAKKRFVYGQGVEFPEGINQAYSGSSVYIDYPFADYTNNYSYPNIGKWNQAIVDNLKVERNMLCTPEYELPEIVLGNGTLENLFSTLGEEQSSEELYFSFNDTGYMYFDNLNFLNQKMRSFYGAFKFLEEPTSKQTLFRLESNNAEDYFEIATNGAEIHYTLKYRDSEQVLAKVYSVNVNEIIPVGVDIDKMSLYFGGNVSSFFGNLNTLKLYVGGNPGLTQTFTGNIYKIGLR